MARRPVADSSFLVALLSADDTHHDWAVAEARRSQPPWLTCDAVLSEAFHLLARAGSPALTALLRRGAVVSTYAIGADLERPLRLMEKYADVPMSLADACLVRMTEISPDPVVLTTGSDFRVYRRHGRQSVPCAMPM